MEQKTWEIIVEAPSPIDVKSLEVVIEEGPGLNFPVKRSYIYNIVNSNWNSFIVEMAEKKKEDIIEAIGSLNDKKYFGCIKHIAAISSMYRFCNASLDGNKLEMEIGITDFKDYIGTMQHALVDEKFRKLLMNAGAEDSGDPNHYFSNSLATCTNIVTSDEKIPLGMRSNTVAIYPNVPHVIGGYIKVNGDNNPDFSVKDMNFAKNMKKELEEELGLEKDDMATMEFFGIIRNIVTRGPEVIYNARVNVTAEKLKEMWRTKSKDKFEHRNITFYSPEEVACALEKYRGDMVPSGEAAVTLFLKNYHPKLLR